MKLLYRHVSSSEGHSMSQSLKWMERISETVWYQSINMNLCWRPLNADHCCRVNRGAFRPFIWLNDYWLNRCAQHSMHSCVIDCIVINVGADCSACVCITVSALYQVSRCRTMAIHYTHTHAPYYTIICTCGTDHTISTTLGIISHSTRVVITIHKFQPVNIILQHQLHYYT